MNYSSISGIYGKLILLLMLAGVWGCKGREEKAQQQDTMVEGKPKEKAIPPRAVTLPDGTRVLMDPRTVIRPSDGFGKSNRDIQLDGEAMLIVRSDAKKPFVIRTRNLVIQVLGTRLHIDAFASSPGEQVDLLEGRLKVIKSYHSSTDNEAETLQAGEMVMINRDIDLMEKETLSPEERKALEVKFPLSDSTADSTAAHK